MINLRKIPKGDRLNPRCVNAHLIYLFLYLLYIFMGFMGVVLHYGLDVALMKQYVQTKNEEKTLFFSMQVSAALLAIEAVFYLTS